VTVAAMSNLQLRILSALVLAAATLVLTWLGGLPFRLLCIGIAAMIFYEWCAMARTAANVRHQLIAAALLAVVLVALGIGMAAAPVLALFGSAVIIVAILGRVGGQGAGTAVGLAYAGFSAISLAYLRDGDGSGLLAILFLFAIVWTTDILAYFVGRAVGGPKLEPAISPGKTWSGAIGGAVGGLAGGLLVAALAGSASILPLAAVALLLSIVSQIGDLFESAVKRRRGVKDSGRLIPGHGGVMDRVDGLVAASFALYVIGWVFGGGADHPAQGLFPVLM
jgi:phosphatidate cytidylyltransferase